MSPANAVTMRVGQDNLSLRRQAATVVDQFVPAAVVAPSAAPLITHTLTLRGVSTADIHEAMAESLRGEGWEVLSPEDAAEIRADVEAEEAFRTPGETPGEFMARVGISSNTLWRAWSDPRCPSVRRELGPLGKQTVRLWATPEFEAWIRRNKKRP